MNRILMFALLAVFALLFAVSTETPLILDDVLMQPSLTAVATEPLLYKRADHSAEIGDLSIATFVTAQPIMVYISSATQDDSLNSSYEASAPGRNERNGIWRGGVTRLL